MQITIEDLSPVEKKVEFELPWSDVAPKLDKAYDSLRRGVKMPGFRPGKVPRAILERMYRRQVEDEVARELVERSLGQAIQENQIQPVAPPAVAEIEIKTGAPFKFSARVEVRSQVTPKDYAGIPVNRRPPQVTDEQIAEALEGYRRRLTQFKPVDGRTETGDADLVRAEISGKVGEHKIKKRELLVDLEDDAGGPLPGLASRLRGKPIGGDAPIEVDYTLPAEGVPTEMAGRHVHLHVSVKEVREKQVPALDDELAKDTGEADTLEGLRAKVREKLVETDNTRIKREVERALIKELVKRNEFPIAPALVDRYAQAIVNRAKSQLMRMGIDVESVDDGKMRLEVKTEAEEEARGAILLQAIGEREGITAGDADVQKRIAELAAGRNESPKQLRAELEKDHRIHQIETQIREQKTLDLLISQAKITDGEPAPSLIVTPEQARQEAASAQKPKKKPSSKKEPTP
ncbi:MAG TPA: trigger factor [Polyangia bacterium]|jgi:trigger factor|nr:trigger factor [Polyangia bacterium]